MIKLDLSPIVHLTHEQFYKLCMANRDAVLERSPQGELVIMTPVGGEGGSQEANLIMKVGVWNELSKLGVVFSSQTVFKLPNGGDRAPDVAWVEQSRWNILTAEERQKFPPLCPDFVIELRSQSDRLASLQAKMREYQASGLRLGWLTDPIDCMVEVYRANREPEALTFPITLSGEDVLPGFSLELN